MSGFHFEGEEARKELGSLIGRTSKLFLKKVVFVDAVCEIKKSWEGNVRGVCRLFDEWYVL